MRLGHQIAVGIVGEQRLEGLFGRGEVPGLHTDHPLAEACVLPVGTVGELLRQFSVPRDRPMRGR